MNSRKFFTGKAIGTTILFTIIGLVLLFFALNNYIYQEKQADEAVVIDETEEFEDSSSNNSASYTGIVTEVNTDQMMVDGPGIIIFETNTGEEKTIVVPSMGIRLCAAFENIANIYDIEVGDTISVAGTENTKGDILPCASQEDYVRVEVE